MSSNEAKTYRVSRLRQIKSRLGLWLARSHGPVSWASHKLFVLLPLLLPTAVFLYAIFLTDQGRDLLRANVGQIRAATRLAIAWCLIVAIVLACAPSFVAPPIEETKPEPGRPSIEILRVMIAEFSFHTGIVCLMAAWIAAMGSFVVTTAATGEETLGLLGLGIAVGMGGVSAALTCAFRFLIFAYRAKWAGPVGIVMLATLTFFSAEIGEWLGSVLMLATALCAWLLIFGWIAEWRRQTRVELTSIFIPVFVILLLSKLIWQMLPLTSARDSISGKRGIWQPSTLESAYAKLVGSQPKQPTIIIVAAAGGGIRASYWTSIVLSRASDQIPGFKSKILLMSGVSGGSLGLATYRSLIEQSSSCSAPSDTGLGYGPLESCAREFHDQDFLAGVLGASLTSEVLNLVIPVFPHRSSALETTWQARWRNIAGKQVGENAFARPFRYFGSEGHELPALVMNTTSVLRGTRIVASTLATEWMTSAPAAPLPCRNIAEHIDLSLSGAANASARFPYVEDWGWFRPHFGPDDTKVKDRTVCHEEEGIADGGFFDNYGAATALDAYKAINSFVKGNIKPKIIVIQITSDPDCDLSLPLDGRERRTADCQKAIDDKQKLKDRKSQWKSMIPLSKEGSEAYQFNLQQEANSFLYGSESEDDDPGVYSVAMSARSVTGVGVALALRSQVLAGEGDRYYHFSLAGAFDAPLGWALSRYARAEIDNLLLNEANKAEMARLAAELNPPLRR